MSDSHAVLALQVLTGYHEVQHRMDELLAARFRQLGQLGEWLTKRSRKLTDDERRSAFMAVAADAGLSKSVARVPNVLGDAKKIRDALAHSVTLGVASDGVRGFKSGAMIRVSAEELEITSWRVFWVLEHVMHIGEVAGLSPTEPFNIVRRSGKRLIDVPPSATPPDRAIDDPSRVPRFDVRYAQMQEREARREREAQAGAADEPPTATDSGS